MAEKENKDNMPPEIINKPEILDRRIEIAVPNTSVLDRKNKEIEKAPKSNKTSRSGSKSSRRDFTNPYGVGKRNGFCIGSG